MYHVSVHSLAERVLAHIRRDELLRPGDRVGVAVSGGIDSVALLRLLLELRHDLGIVLSVVHFNHKLRGAESEADQEFVAALAREHGLEFNCSSGDVVGLAAEQRCGVEAAAREMRYGFFRQLLVEGISAAEAALDIELNRSAESAAPPQSIPHGLKPNSPGSIIGTTKAVPFAVSHAQLDGTGEESFPVSPAQDVALLRALPTQEVGMPRSILDKIATGHTLDDQAETVLLRLIRGTGLRGLAAIHPRILIENEYSDDDDDDGGLHGEIIRPLLGIRHRELEKYLRDLGQPWREDSSNADSKFTRNRVRTLILPLLEREFNPAVVENFSELAELARDEEDYWANEVSGWLGTVVQWSEPEWVRSLPGFGASQPLVQIQPQLATPQSTTSQPAVDSQLMERMEQPGPAVMNASVSRPWLLTEPKAVQRRVLKAIGEEAGIPLVFKHIEEMLRFAAEDGPAGKELSLPLGWKVVREAEAIVFVTPDLRRQERIPNYEYSLAVPGRVLVPELGIEIEALHIPAEPPLETNAAEYNPEQLLRADLLSSELIVRNWRAGDRFFPAHTKSQAKVKELLQQRHIVQPERRLWPVVLRKDSSELVWMRGFAVPAALRARAGQPAIVIREIPWTEETAL
jgi:tRNA(Ile)-lysidine synthase